MRSKLSAVSLKGVAAMGLLSLLMGLVGCDQQRIAELEEGVATEADVRARFGEPEKTWSAADMASVPATGGAAQALTAPGARTLEYNRQPQGVVNYMISSWFYTIDLNEGPTWGAVFWDVGPDELHLRWPSFTEFITDYIRHPDGLLG